MTHNYLCLHLILNYITNHVFTFENKLIKFEFQKHLQHNILYKISTKNSINILEYNTI